MFVPRASDSAGLVDSSISFILWIEIALFAIVVSAMILFMAKYRKKKNSHPKNIEGGTWLEILWTAVPVVLVLIMFYVGWRSFVSIRKVPEDAMTVNVVSRQWTWQFSYESGKQSDTLIAPIGKPVKLVLSSEDVVHSFYVPAFRIKEDCVPGMKTYLWFTAKETGSYDIFCTEYCGLGHSSMLSKVIVVAEKDFDSWYQAKVAPDEKGKAVNILESKGCTGCHSIDGSEKIGPTFKGIFGRREKVWTGKALREIIVDEEYLRRSIREPGADVVKGYSPVMPGFALSEDELMVLIEYLKALK